MYKHLCGADLGEVISICSQVRSGKVKPLNLLAPIGDDIVHAYLAEVFMIMYVLKVL